MLWPSQTYAIALSSRTVIATAEESSSVRPV
jgi:hypothetical protein